MPIYEFYCRKCNTIYNFFSPDPSTRIKSRHARAVNIRLFPADVCLYRHHRGKEGGARERPVGRPG